jgi:hypothetical protein
VGKIDPKTIEIARMLWNWFKDMENARIIADRRGIKNFIVALALARHLRILEKKIPDFSVDKFDPMLLDSTLTHRENIEELTRRGILPKLPEEPSREDLLRETIRQYEEALEIGTIPEVEPKITLRDEFGDEIRMVYDTKFAEEYREARKKLKRKYKE